MEGCSRSGSSAQEVHGPCRVSKRSWVTEHVQSDSSQETEESWGNGSNFNLIVHHKKVQHNKQNIVSKGII